MSIVNLEALKMGYDRRCSKGCQYSSKLHKSCPEHGGRSKKLMTLEELAIENIEQAHEIRQLKKLLTGE
jgi:hypothetical protein